MECEDVKTKYKELVYKLREAAALSEALATIMSFSEGNATAQLYNAAADAIEDLDYKYQRALSDLVKQAELPKEET